MTDRLVIDASIAIKWVIAEVDSGAAVALRDRFSFLAPELIVAECANILWKKVQRGELTAAEAGVAARLLAASGVDWVPMAGLMGPATDLALRLQHPAYDCFYLALALERRTRFVTADRRFVAAVRATASPRISELCLLPSDLG